MSGEDTQDRNTDQAGSEPTEAETKARSLGWRPEDEWSGDKDGWLPADEFMARNERLQKRGDKILQAQLTRNATEIADLKATIKDLGEHLTRADQRAYERAIRDLERKADEAVTEGDADAYKAARAEIQETRKQAEADAKAAAKAKTDTKAATNPDEDPAFQAWVAENAWYDPRDDGFEPELAGHAERIAPQIAKLGLTGEAFYARVTKEVKKKFPEHFGNARRRQPNTVEGGGRTARTNGTGYSDLPAEAKAACDRFVKQKVWSDIKADSDAEYAKKARERYCREYFAE